MRRVTRPYALCNASCAVVQIRARDYPTKLRLRDPTGRTYIDKLTSFHGVLATADFPAFGDGLPAKGGATAYRFDRVSDIDTRSEHYGKPSSLLRQNVAGIPSYFKRRTSAGVAEVVARAAREKTKGDIEAMLTDNGLCYHNFKFVCLTDSNRRPAAFCRHTAAEKSRFGRARRRT